jgi:hypothetical protein
VLLQQQVSDKELMEFRNLEASATRLGLEVQLNHDTKSIALVNVNNALPAYRNDYAIYMGTAEEVRGFLAGWQSNVLYLQSLGITSHEKIRAVEKKLLEKKAFDKLSDK